MEPDNDYTTPRLPKKHPYTVPDRYFDELPMRIQQRVQHKPAFGGFSLPVLRPQRLGLMLASFLVILTGVWFALKQNTAVNRSENAVALTELTDAEVASYLADNYHLLEPADVAAVSVSDELLPETVPALEPHDLVDEIDYATLDEYYL